MKALHVVAPVACALLALSCKSESPSTYAVNECGSISGTLTLHKPSGSPGADPFTAPVTGCMTYFSDGTTDRIEIGFCNEKYLTSEDVCATLLLATPNGSAKLTTFDYPYPDDQSTLPFFTGDTMNGTATLLVADTVCSYQACADPNPPTEYTSLSGGFVNVANATWAVKVGDTGSVQVSATDLPLSDGASVTFNVQVGFSVVQSEPASAGGSGSSSGSSGGSSGGSCMPTVSCDASGLLGTCMNGNDNTSQMACYCAAACDCALACDTSCYSSNEASASMLGGSCGF